MAWKEAGTRLEVDLIGDEGMLGISLLLGVHVLPLQDLMQGAGLPLRMPAALFQLQLEFSPALRRSLKRYRSVCINHRRRSPNSLGCGPCLHITDLVGT